MFLQTIVSQSNEQRNIKVMIVGTHRDIEYKCWESRSNKEQKLKDIITSFGLQKKVIYTDKTLSRLIFAVNALHPKDQDCAIGQNIMDFILNENDAEDVSIPLKYLHLELTLKKLTESKE